MYKSLILTFSLFFSLFAEADEGKMVFCRLGKLVRTIRAMPSENGCKAVYTKAGVDRVVGTGRRWQSCYDFVNNIKKNLESGSWKCREISKFKVVSKADRLSSSDDFLRWE